MTTDAPTGFAAAPGSEAFELEPRADSTKRPERSGAGGVNWLQRERSDAIRAGLFVCYECKDDRCGYCIGIPCMCPCPIPETEPEYSI